MKAFFLPPNDKCSGNLLWSICEILNFENEKISSLEMIRNKGYWASAFPEGDGVVFTSDTHKKSDEILLDFQECFKWLEIEISSLKNAKMQLALIDSEYYISCTITVPLKQIRIETSCSIAENYKYLANEANDTIEVKRLADFDSEQIEFQLEIKYGDLLQLNLISLEHDNYVINQCLDYADRGIDIIRFMYSSFERPEFTPNPAGQVEHGFYEVQISPNIRIPVKTKTYGGISKPFSVSNNWLGPEVCPSAFGLNDYKLSEIFIGNNKSELGNLVIGSFRNCRQAFYAFGEESKFLSLIFSIDGLTSPDNLKGWKHRTYIAVLACQEDLSKFGKILKNYDYLYTDIRNKLVHEGKSFYELEEDSSQCCELLWSIYKNIICLILNKNFTKTKYLINHTKSLLTNQSYIDEYEKIIHQIDSKRTNKDGKPKKIEYPKW